MADGTQTYTLGGQTYTVPAGTSMDELDKYIKAQKPDELSQKTQKAAEASGVGKQPRQDYVPSGMNPVTGSRQGYSIPPGYSYPPVAAAGMSKKGLFGEDVSPTGEENIMRAGNLANRTGEYQPVSTATSAMGLAELPGAVSSGVRNLAGRFETADKIPIPGTGGAVKFRIKTPNPYEEMGASAQFRTMAREAAKPPKMEYPLPGAQSTAPSAIPPAGSLAAPVGRGPTTSTGPSAAILPPRGYPGAETAATRLGTPGTAPQGRSVILPGENIDPLAVRSAGSAAQATEEDLRRLARFGDQSARQELIRRRLPLGTEGQINYGNAPLPRAEYPAPQAAVRPPVPIRPAGEVMVQPTPTSRATPTGEARIFEGRGGQLPPELHADLERQAGRKLTNEEAIALDRENAENAMAEGKGKDLTSTREEHRAKLEKKGRR